MKVYGVLIQLILSDLASVLVHVKKQQCRMERLPCIYDIVSLQEILASLQIEKKNSISNSIRISNKNIHSRLQYSPTQFVIK